MTTTSAINLRTLKELHTNCLEPSGPNLSGQVVLYCIVKQAIHSFLLPP